MPSVSSSAGRQDILSTPGTTTRDVSATNLPLQIPKEPVLILRNLMNLMMTMTMTMMIMIMTTTLTLMISHSEFNVQIHGMESVEIIVIQAVSGPGQPLMAMDVCHKMLLVAVNQRRQMTSHTSSFARTNAIQAVRIVLSHGLKMTLKCSIPKKQSADVLITVCIGTLHEQNLLNVSGLLRR